MMYMYMGKELGVFYSQRLLSPTEPSLKHFLVLAGLNVVREGVKRERVIPQCYINVENTSTNQVV